MTEKDWVNNIIIPKLKSFNDKKYRIKPNVELIYASEIKQYNGTNNPKHDLSHRYKTDILIFEHKNENLYKPRIVIEVKRGINTHDSITYSQKAINHKFVHPYLRYGILIKSSNGIPSRLFWHGSYFDFMFSWNEYNPKKYELDHLTDLIKKELKTSEKIEKMIYSNRKIPPEHYYMIHRSLKIKPEKQK